MTDNEKYQLLLEELAELIRSKNNEIAVQKYRIELLEEQIKKICKAHNVEIEKR